MNLDTKKIIDAEIKKNGNTNLITNSNLINNQQIHAIGDSHSIFFYNSLYIYEHWGFENRIPITMYSFINNNLNLYDVGKLLGNGHELYPIKANDFVLYCYGYNDFQRRVLQHSTENTLYNNIDYLLQKYINTILDHKDKFKIIPIINCIYPNPQHYAQNVNTLNSDEIRYQITTYVNKYLQEKCNENNILYFDIYNFIKDDKGFIKNEYTKDGIHLDYDNEYLRNIIDNLLLNLCKNYLHKSLNL